MNLLDNAAKYAPLGSLIRIRARAAEKRVLLTVEDEGPGIPPESLPHIFDKFYRAKAADRRVAGTGLGLAVARGFVEAFGGSLDAANRTDSSGAVLTISLPTAPKRRTPMATRLPKILIVDDEPQIRRFLRASLPAHGYECIEAGDRREALRSFAKEQPDASSRSGPAGSGWFRGDQVHSKRRADADRRAFCKRAISKAR